MEKQYFCITIGKAKIIFYFFGATEMLQFCLINSKDLLRRKVTMLLLPLFVISASEERVTFFQDD